MVLGSRSCEQLGLKHEVWRDSSVLCSSESFSVLLWDLSLVIVNYFGT